MKKKVAILLAFVVMFAMVPTTAFGQTGTPIWSFPSTDATITLMERDQVYIGGIMSIPLMSIADEIRRNAQESEGAASHVYLSVILEKGNFASTLAELASGGESVVPGAVSASFMAWTDADLPVVISSHQGFYPVLARMSGRPSDMLLTDVSVGNGSPATGVGGLASFAVSGNSPSNSLRDLVQRRDPITGVLVNRHPAFGYERLTNFGPETLYTVPAGGLTPGAAIATPAAIVPGTINVESNVVAMDLSLDGDGYMMALVRLEFASSDVSGNSRDLRHVEFQYTDLLHLLFNIYFGLCDTSEGVRTD